jgi:hypothetical protein
MEPADTTKLNDLKWAERAQDVDPQVGLAELLVALQLLATDEDRKASVNKTWREGTPASMQVIKSGALSITKWSSTWVAGAGGLSAATAAIIAFIGGLRSEISDAIIVALIGGAALILSATGIAVALFVKGDLEARGQATAARHEGRAEVAATFLRATADMPKVFSAGDAHEAAPDASPDQFLLALAAFPARVYIRTKDEPTYMLVTGIKTHPTYRVQIGTAGGWVAIDQVDGFTTDPPPK